MKQDIIKVAVGRKSIWPRDYSVQLDPENELIVLTLPTMLGFEWRSPHEDNLRGVLDTAWQLLEGAVVSFCSYPFINPAGVSESAWSQHLISWLEFFVLVFAGGKGEDTTHTELVLDFPRSVCM